LDRLAIDFGGKLDSDTFGTAIARTDDYCSFAAVAISGTQELRAC
jgi:hypothetical protein